MVMTAVVVMAMVVGRREMAGGVERAGVARGVVRAVGVGGNA